MQALAETAEKHRVSRKSISVPINQDAAKRPCRKETLNFRPRHLISCFHPFFSL